MRMSALFFVSGLALTLAACSSSPDRNPYYSQTTQYKGSSPVAQSVPNPVQQATYRTQIQAQSAANSQAQPMTYPVQAAAPVSYQGQPASYTQINQECLSKEGDRKLIGTVAGGVVGGLAGRAITGDNKTLGTVAGAAIGGAAGFGIADKTIRCDPIAVPAPQSATIAQAYQPSMTIYADSATTAAAPLYQRTATEPAIQETTQSLGNAGTPGYYAVNGIPDHTPAELPPTQIYQAPTYASQTTIIDAPSVGTYSHVLAAGDTVYSLARSACVSVNEFKQLNNIDDLYYIRAGDPILIPNSRCID